MEHPTGSLSHGSGFTHEEVREKEDNEQFSQEDRTQETWSGIFIRSEPADKAS